MKRIKDWVKNNLIGFLVTAIISAIIGGLISWGINWILPTKSITANNIPKKELTCILNYSQRIFVNKSNDTDFKIVYGEQEVRDPYYFSITIKNTGDEAITNEDFKRAFYIDFVDCKELIKASVIESTNKDIFDEILDKAQINKTQLVFSDFFLNPSEEFTLSIITESQPSQIKYNPRIEGISNIKIINTTVERINQVEKDAISPAARKLLEENRQKLVEKQKSEKLSKKNMEIYINLEKFIY